MMQCPHCAHRTFETGITISARVRVTGLEDGDYHEQEIDSYGRDWHALCCCRCEKYTSEEEAREAFEVEALYDHTTDDVYAFYDARKSRVTSVAADESLLSIAGAWNLWLWQQERADV